MSQTKLPDETKLSLLLKEMIAESGALQTSKETSEAIVKYVVSYESEIEESRRIIAILEKFILEKGEGKL